MVHKIIHKYSLKIIMLLYIKSKEYQNYKSITRICIFMNPNIVAILIILIIIHMMVKVENVK